MCVHAQSCQTLCNSLVCSTPGFSILGVSQTRILGWFAIFYSRYWGAYIFSNESFSYYFFFPDIYPSVIAGSYDSFIFNFWRNSHNVFHSGYTNLRSYQEYTMALFFPHPLQHLFFVSFIINMMTVIRCSHCGFHLHSFDDQPFNVPVKHLLM